jgi:D-lactate dehydrogenase
MAASSVLNRSFISGRKHGHTLFVPTRRIIPSLFSTSATTTSSSTQNNPSISIPTAFLLAAGSLLGGYCIGTSHSNHWNEINKNRELPKGERGCCSCDGTATSSPKIKLTEAQSALPTKLTKIVGKQYVHDGLVQTSKNVQFLKGARLGEGHALAIVQPGTLEEAVKCLQAIVDAGCVVQPQGSNTGLTGG